MFLRSARGDTVTVPQHWINGYVVGRPARPTRSSTTTESSSLGYLAAKELPVDKDGRQGQKFTGGDYCGRSSVNISLELG